MKKFIIHTLKGKPSIIEVECTKLTPMEMPSLGWLPEGEYRARIDAPTILFEKTEKPVWYSFAFFDTVEQAKEKAESDIRNLLERTKRKSNIDFTEEDVKKQLADIQVITL